MKTLVCVTLAIIGIALIRVISIVIHRIIGREARVVDTNNVVIFCQKDFNGSFGISLENPVWNGNEFGFFPPKRVALFTEDEAKRVIKGKNWANVSYMRLQHYINMLSSPKPDVSVPGNLSDVPKNGKG